VGYGVQRWALHAVPLLEGRNAIPIAAVECLEPLGECPAGRRAGKRGLLSQRRFHGEKGEKHRRSPANLRLKHVVLPVPWMPILVSDRAVTTNGELRYERHRDAPHLVSRERGCDEGGVSGYLSLPNILEAYSGGLRRMQASSGLWHRLKVTPKPERYDIRSGPALLKASNPWDYVQSAWPLPEAIKKVVSGRR
jgi:hypothetical protein